MNRRAVSDEWQPVSSLGESVSVGWSISQSRHDHRHRARQERGRGCVAAQIDIYPGFRSDGFKYVLYPVGDYTTSRFHTSLRAAIGILEGRPSVVEIMSQGPEFDARSR